MPSPMIYECNYAGFPQRVLEVITHSLTLLWFGSVEWHWRPLSGWVEVAFFLISTRGLLGPAARVWP